MILICFIINFVISLTILLFIRKGKIVNHSRVLKVINIIHIALLLLLFVGLFIIVFIDMFFESITIVNDGRTFGFLITFLYICVGSVTFLSNAVILLSNLLSKK